MRIPFTRALVPAALLALTAFGWSRSQAPQAMGPSTEQKRLAPLVGEWEGKLTMQSPMGKIESVGVEKNRMICDGKWLESVFECDIMGMPFQGRGLMGWDAEKKSYQGVWVDSMGPAFTVMSGQWDDASKGVVWTYESTDQMGRKGTNRNTEVMTDPNTRTAKFFFKPHGEGEAETLTMEIEYKRKGADKSAGKPAEAASGTKSGD